MMEFADVAIYLHRDYVDFRKQINGLSAIVQDVLGHDIFTQSVFVFCNKKRDKLKVVYWDKTGFCLWHKRLDNSKGQSLCMIVFDCCMYYVAINMGI